MYLESLATSVPDCRLTQAECWERFRSSRAATRLSLGARGLVRRVLLGNSGIDTRHFALPPDEALFDMDAEALNKAFEAEAPPLGENALRDALEQAELRPADLDALIVCTCTGYLCPGLSSFIAERTRLRRDACLLDLAGLGCGAAIPSMRTAAGLLAADPAARVAVVAVELCSAAYYMDEDPGVIISACLFGDGAAAAVFSAQPAPGRHRFHGFDSFHLPEERGGLRFENHGGKLRNRLAQSVPAVAATAVSRLRARRPAPLSALPAGAPPEDASAQPHCITHGGGRLVLDALGPALGDAPLAEARTVLRRHGNLSSPSVLFALREYLDTAAARPPKGGLWLASFGAGFSAHSCACDCD
ncbi:MAG: stilbene synthase [Opitutales bacterium]|nr:stilbene synthase [Opitutales bacterium]